MSSAQFPMQFAKIKISESECISSRLTVQLLLWSLRMDTEKWAMMIVILLVDAPAFTHNPVRKFAQYYNNFIVRMAND